MSSEYLTRVAAALLFVAVHGCGGASEQPPGTSDAGGSAAANRATTPSTPPPEATIKSLLERDMWGPSAQGGTQHTYEYLSLKIAAPRQGDYLTDGVPADRPTSVFPVKVEVHITKQFTDGSTSEDHKHQSYVFFQDEFGDWTYRFKENH